MLLRPALALTILVFMASFGAVECRSQEAPAPASPPAEGAAKEKRPTGPLSPDQAVTEFRLPAGLRIELAACEPQVIDPVAMRFDERGRMWVVEMGDYPHGPAEGESPKSRIRILEDQDGDGRFETSTIFADGLLFATGVQPWKDGAFVTMAGQIAYFRDADGDGKAEASETWYAGFEQENSQLRANHPRLGWDGYIYVANGLRGGSVFDPNRPDMPALSISGMDFRFHPHTRAFEAVTGNGQFGMAFDDAGNRHTCSNRNPLRRVIVEDGYLKRSPLALISESVHDVAAFGEASRLFPLTRAWTTSNLHAGQFTAACGVNFYRGDGLPQEYRGDSFTCDPTGNLVHREKLAPVGAVDISAPVHQGVEFLASRDEWFRPVNIENGPDGALYVVDMYRAVIEHPQFMPDELKTRPDLRLGDDRGRIWRIVIDSPPATAANSKSPSLAEMSAEQLVGELSSANGWRRATAARLLFSRQDAAAAPALAQAATTIEPPAGRAAALWLLRGLGALTDATLSQSFTDPSPVVRRQAILLAEQRLNEPASAGWREAIGRLASDGDAAVRMQAALSLSPAAAAELPRIAEIAQRGLSDAWTRRAVAVAAGARAGELAAQLAPALTQLASEDLASRAGAQELLIDLAGQTGRTGQTEQRTACIGGLVALPEAMRSAQFAALEACLLSASRNGAAPDAVLAELAPDVRARLEAIFATASGLAHDAALPASERIAAIRLASLTPAAAGEVQKLALHEPDQAVRREALTLLARQADPAPWRELLSRFPGESPAIRAAVLDGVLATTDRSALLIEELSTGRIKPGEMDAARADRLLRHADNSIRVRANELFGALTPADRQKALADYQACLQLAADATRGRQIFAKNCANCHRIGDLGVNVAPDISDSRVKTAEQILTDVLQPNRAIDSNYVSYTVITSDGRALSGVLAAETATSITLRQPEDKTVVLSRGEIEEMRSNGVSLMPEGLEKAIPLQDMADLIAFIKNWRYLDGLTPLGESTTAASGP